ncbi:DivIVA domain-containing protein [Nocardioides sp. CFH 31398]|uniref:DivIVA domain-containing protein n=1 Tax=Nocardioides sp. CFH 31398 TaxID=2919579 RepID=UPI001F0603F2|nr:DivIVA domain-containing protein [Nocardioides sp. CFH 31398]MCH1868017.1 DivIVA domain-containing protein [Nocardioides sp. CFH 31398]
MTWVFAILLVLAMGGVAAVASGRGSGLAQDDEPAPPSPADGPLDAAGLRAVRFPLALRGYRMADVDALLDRLAQREAEREVEERARRYRGGEPDDDEVTGP